MYNKVINNENGFAALMAMILVGMMTLIGLAALSTTDDEISITGNELKETRAFYAAEAGLEMAAARLHDLSDSNLILITSLPEGKEEVHDCVFIYETTDGGPAVQKVLNNGTLAGLQASVKTYTITSSGYHVASNSKVEITQNFDLALVPVFQYAVFYNNDLELAPGTDMSILGRIHSNGDIWIQSGGTLEVDSYLTAAGDIRHGRKGPGSVDNGDIFIKNGVGVQVNMKEGSDWLESIDPHWYDSSVAKWSGRVQDNAHGQNALNFPIVGSGDPRKMIERESGNADSYEAKASLKFINNRAYQLVGTVWNDVTADMKAKGIITISNNKFYDQRESQWVDVMELDIAKMYDESYDPENGIIYFNKGGGGYPALRINNAELLDGNLTIASDNPVYTKGNFNSSNKKAASIMADAVTVLSSAFDDALSDQNKNLRVAENTIVNASIITGNVETDATNYNGGFENLTRMLEDWTGKNFTWTGSMVNLWESEQADANWNTTYFSEPTRNWSYDQLLDDPLNHPPGTPTIRVILRTGWSMSDVSHGMDDFSNVQNEVILSY